MADFMSNFRGADISSSGLMAERNRMEIIANNIANAYTTRGENGEPYRRHDAVFQSIVDGSVETSGAHRLGGVRILGVEADKSDFPAVYNPGHPDADDNGMVKMPNVQLPNEMVDLITATRSYEANLKALKSYKQMTVQTLSILEG